MRSIKIPILSKKEEFDLIFAWQSKCDKKAMDKIIKAYKRMPEAYARKFSKYGTLKQDLINEGIIGVIHAVNKFDLKKNLRLSTYASWWIKAFMQDYILKNWSIVRTASTASHKSLFFGLNKIKSKILNTSNGFLMNDQIKDIAKQYNVKTNVISDMESKLTFGDQSLNQRINDSTNSEFISNLIDDRPNPEDIVSAMKDNKSRSRWLQQALNTLSNREKEIVERKLHNKVLTLEKLSKKIGVSKERIRQIEAKAYQKLNKKILSLSGQSKNFFINNE